MLKVQLDIQIGESTLSAAVNLPGGTIRPVELLPVLHALNDALITVAAEKAEGAGKHVSCRAGCGACCRQLVPISETEARYLAELIAAMPEGRKRHVMARFVVVGEALVAGGLLERVRASADADSQQLHHLAMEYFQLGVPCPFLEDESCSIHPDRPSICREYLVTSPAANCAVPRADNIEKLALPAKLSRVLYRFSDGMGQQETRWLALPLLLEWAAGHENDPQPVLPSRQLFENFMSRVAIAESLEQGRD